VKLTSSAWATRQSMTSGNVRDLDWLILGGLLCTPDLAVKFVMASKSSI
jgi:hypothetical protein